MRTFNPISRADTAPVISPHAAKVLRNTYMLLGITLLPTILGAFVGVQFNPLALMGLWSLLLFIPVMLGFQAMIIRNRHSVAGVWWLLGFTFAMGWMLVGPSVGMALGSFRNGAELVGMAVGGTAAIFFVLAGYATVTQAQFHRRRPRQDDDHRNDDGVCSVPYQRRFSADAGDCIGDFGGVYGDCIGVYCHHC